MAYICICNAIKESDIRKIIKHNPSYCIKDLQKINIGDRCKKCLKEINQIVKGEKNGFF